jgi:hypothetical protein
MPLSPAERLLYGLIGCVIGWGILFLAVGFPVFHLHFKVPIATIASYASICCVVQVAVLAWLLYMRKTVQRPDAWIFYRTVAVTVLATTIPMLFFYYLRRGRPDPDTREFTSIGMGVTLLFAVLLPVISLVSRRMRNGQT